MPDTRGVPLLGTRSAHDMDYADKHASDIEDGVFTYHLPQGDATGQIVRYNTVTSAWEVVSEPLIFKGLVLTPAVASLVEAEGAIYYDSNLKAILVCTDV